MYIPRPQLPSAARPFHLPAAIGTSPLLDHPEHDDLRAPNFLSGLLLAASRRLHNVEKRRFEHEHDRRIIAPRTAVQDTNVTIGVVVGILIAVFLAAVFSFMYIYRGSIKVTGRRRRRKRKHKSGGSSKSSKTSEGGAPPPPPPADG